MIRRLAEMHVHNITIENKGNGRWPLLDVSCSYWVIEP